MNINEQAHETLLAEIEGISDVTLNKKPSPDVWSVKQNLEHLFLLEMAIISTIQNQLENGEEDNVEEKPIHLTVNRTTKVDAPGYAQPGDEFASLEDMIKKVNTAYEKLQDLEQNTDEGSLAGKSFTHPTFGKMSLKQWIPFVGYHEMRHVEQIKEVKEALKE